MTRGLRTAMFTLIAGTLALAFGTTAFAQGTASTVAPGPPECTSTAIANNADNSGTLTVSCTNLLPGSSVTATVQGPEDSGGQALQVGGETVTIQLAAAYELAARFTASFTGTASPTGTFSHTFDLPSGSNPGAYTVTVAGIGTNGQPASSQSVAVLRLDATTTPDIPRVGGSKGPLARTGASVIGLTLAGAATTTLGAFFIIGARRRRSSTSA